MRDHHYNQLFIKIAAAIVSAIVLTLFISWTIYTPESERMADTAYTSYFGIFAFNFVPIFFICIIFGAMLSPVADGVLYRRFHMEGVRGVILLLIAYLLLGMVCGMIVSMFFGQISFMSGFIRTSIICAVVFLFFQILLQALFYTRARK
ncbi:hypothetical protein [Paenibacillus urinalis]|uniref:Uncharacterized protein n=1 Tax=Paenibacillus urinalis TaxID=521520 RepID=A0AAX3N082_9BACL|nr:hypothetical protein [Paenibacillus urinalis]WDH83111.1 hypothetical protein PUW23_02375 [Paenibacillus urinalis]